MSRFSTLPEQTFRSGRWACLSDSLSMQTLFRLPSRYCCIMVAFTGPSVGSAIAKTRCKRCRVKQLRLLFSRFAMPCKTGICRGKLPVCSWHAGKSSFHRSFRSLTGTHRATKQLPPKNADAHPVVCNLYARSCIASDPKSIWPPPETAGIHTSVRAVDMQGSFHHAVSAASELGEAKKH